MILGIIAQGAAGGLYPFSVPILNPGAEDAPANPSANWVITLGGMQSITGPSGDGTLPRTGVGYFYAGSNSYSVSHQDWEVPANMFADIDAGNLTLDVQYYLSCTGTDAGRVIAIFDNQFPFVAQQSNNGQALTSPGGSNVWVLQGTNGFAIPSGTRAIRFQWESDRNAGSSNDAYTDDISAVIRKP